MSRQRHTPEQIIRKLAEGQKLLAGGMDLEGVCRQLEIAESTWARWLAQYGGMKADDAKRLKELEAENARLKKLLAEAELDKSDAQGVGGGKLLTPNRRRAAVTMLRDRFVVSEQRACQVVGQHRSTQRLDAPVPPDDEAELRSPLRAFSRRRPGGDGGALRKSCAGPAGRSTTSGSVAYGATRASRSRSRLARSGWSGSAPTSAMSPIAPNALWALDFQFDHTIDHRQVKMLNIVDEYTRECLAIRVDHSITADDVVAVLDRLADGRIIGWSRVDRIC